MAYYSVLDITPTKEDWIPGYLPIANALVTKHGGKYLCRTPSHEQIEGNSQHAALRIILEWPTRDATMAFMKAPEYASHLKARTEGSISHHYLIEGKDDLA